MKASEIIRQLTQIRLDTRDAILKRLKNEIKNDKAGFMSAEACCKFIEDLNCLDLIEKEALDQWIIRK